MSISLGADLTSEVVAAAMLDGLKKLIRDQLKEEILKDLDPYIEKAVDGALETFNLSLNNYYNADPMTMNGKELLVKVLLEKKIKHIYEVTK